MAITQTLDGTALTSRTDEVQLDLGEVPNNLQQDMMRKAQEAKQQFQQSVMEWKRENHDLIQGGVLEFDGFRPELKPEVRQRTLIRKYLDVEHDYQPEDSLTYDINRDAVADRLFDGRGKGSDEAFFGELKTYYAGRKKKQDNMQYVTSNAFNDMLRGGVGMSESTQAWMDAQEDSEEYGKRYREARKVFNDKLQSELGTFGRNMVRDVFKAFEAGDEDDGAMAAVNLNFAKMSAEERDKAARYIGYLAKNLPKEERDGFLDYVAKSWRGVEGTGRGLMNYLDRGASIHADLAPMPPRQSRLGTVYQSFDKHLEDEKNFKERLANEVAKNDFYELIRSTYENEYDPVSFYLEDKTVLGAIERGTHAMPGVISTSAVAMVPYVGVHAMAGIMYEDTKKDFTRRLFENGVNLEEAAAAAEGWAALATVPAALLERAGAKGLKGKLPFLDKWTTQAMSKISANAGTKLAVRGGFGTVQETGIELTQQLINELTVDLAHAYDERFPDIQWSGPGGVVDGYAYTILETAVSVAPLSMGASGALSKSQRGEIFAKATDLELKAFGAKQADIDRYNKAKGTLGEEGALDILTDNRDANSEEAKEASEQLRDQINESRRLFEDAVKARVMPNIMVNKDGFTVTDKETGDVVGTVKTREEALEMALDHVDLKGELSKDRIDYYSSLIEGAEYTLENDNEARETGVQVRLDNFVTEAEAMLENAKDAAQVMKQLQYMEKLGRGNSDMTSVVLGQSVTEFEGKQRKTINKINGGASILTVFHEDAHGWYREALATGRITKDEVKEFFQMLDKALAGKNVERGVNKGGELRFLPAEGKITDTMLDEAVAEFFEVDVLRTRKGKPDSLAAAISRNLSAIARMNGAGAKFKAFVDAMREFYELALRRVAVIRKGIRDGVISEADIDAFRAAIQGTTEQGQSEADMVDGDNPFSIDSNPFYNLYTNQIHEKHRQIIQERGAQQGTRTSQEEQVLATRAEAGGRPLPTYLGEGTESKVFAYGQDLVLKIPRPSGALAYSRDGKITRSADPKVWELKARSINLLGGMPSSVINIDGQPVILQDRGLTPVTEEELQGVRLPFNITPQDGLIYRLEFDDQIYLVSDLAAHNFVKDSKGNIRLVDLVIGEVAPDASFYGDISDSSFSLGHVSKTDQSLSKFLREGDIGPLHADIQRPITQDRKGAEQLDAKAEGAATFSLDLKTLPDRIERAAKTPSIHLTIDTGGDKKLLRSEAAEKAKQVLLKGVKNEHAGIEVFANNKSFKHTKDHAGSHRRIAILGEIEQVIKGATWLVAADPDQRKEEQRLQEYTNHHLAHPVTINGSPYVAWITVQKSHNGRNLYNIQDIELLETKVSPKEAEVELNKPTPLSSDDISTVIRERLKVKELLQSEDVSLSIGRASQLDERADSLDVEANERSLAEETFDYNAVPSFSVDISHLNKSPLEYSYEPEANIPQRVQEILGQERAISVYPEVLRDSLRQFEAATGTSIRFFQPEEGQLITAFTTRSLPDTIFINSRANTSLAYLIGHEWTHVAQKDSAIAEDLRKLIETYTSDRERRILWEYILHLNPYTEAERLNEIEAHIFGDIISNTNDFGIDALSQSQELREKGLKLYHDATALNPDAHAGVSDSELASFSIGKTTNLEYDEKHERTREEENADTSGSAARTALERLERWFVDDPGREGGANAAQRIDSETESLLAWARGEGLLIRPDSWVANVKEWTELEGASEHEVYILPNGERVIKSTIPPNFGARGVVLDYVRNQMAANRLFGDNIRLEGILDIDGTSIVISQPYVKGVSPTEAEVAEWFESQGYEKAGYNRWKHPETGADVADAHTGNLIKTKDGDIVPIDLQILKEPKMDGGSGANRSSNFTGNEGIGLDANSSSGSIGNGEIISDDPSFSIASNMSNKLDGVVEIDDVALGETLSKPTSFKRIMDQANNPDNKRRVEVIYVHRSFAKAFEGIVERYLEEGRMVPLDVAVEAHLGAQETLFEIYDDLVENGGYMTIVSNDGDFGDLQAIKKMSIEELNDKRYTKIYGKEIQKDSSRDSGRRDHRESQEKYHAQNELAEQGRAILRQAQEEGKIDQATYEALLGSYSNVGGGLDANRSSNFIGNEGSGLDASSSTGDGGIISDDPSFSIGPGKSKGSADSSKEKAGKEPSKRKKKVAQREREEELRKVKRRGDRIGFIRDNYSDIPLGDRDEQKNRKEEIGKYIEDRHRGTKVVLDDAYFTVDEAVKKGLVSMDKAIAKMMSVIPGAKDAAAHDNVYVNGTLQWEEDGRRCIQTLYKGGDVGEMFDMMSKSYLQFIAKNGLGYDYFREQLKNYQKDTGEVLFKDLENISEQDVDMAFAKLARAHLSNKGERAHPLFAKYKHVRRIIEYFGEFFNHVRETAQNLIKLKKAGKLDKELETHLDKATGIKEVDFAKERERHTPPRASHSEKPKTKQEDSGAVDDLELVYRELPKNLQKHFKKFVKQVIHNPEAKAVVLGHYQWGGKSYEKAARQRGAVYYWNRMTSGLSEADMWEVNKAVIDWCVANGKQIFFTHDPMDPKHYSAYARELKHLDKKHKYKKFRKLNEWTWETHK
ncbi:hypothetical protein SAMN02745181_0548 [Rubritalea squalenifaciens DSM 18772]|uniref:Large polyvalent protein-associated domain-containing protein n=1 Tax=Rubritalea squalenifaciens DSM 18772 TaxID=1123071 RepID=A0A1M6CRH8_9BACT|nr:hypothetical protein [Rubritalea squalenifaciens]SHI63617.1 hypothetical protein SAMN02745181_0548 [Rubritalea squalenifaciens DSM 18772]